MRWHAVRYGRSYLRGFQMLKASPHRRRLASSLLLIWLLAPALATAATQVNFLSLADNGSAVLVLQQEGQGPKHAVLYDTGCGSARCVARVKAAINTSGADDLVVIVSHWDYDHGGALSAIVQEYAPVPLEPG